MEQINHTEGIEDIDHTQTFVLIIGVSEFPEDKTINPIPNVLTNISLLKSTLLNADLIGVPEDNIFLSINENRKQIERQLSSIAVLTSRNPQSTLVVYYSGHGILSANDFKLYLTTHDTSKKFLEIDAIHIDTFKRHIRKSHAARKIVILDCCHSGAFIEDATMGDISGIIQTGINDFEGTYVMTSAAADEPALFPVDSPDKPTHFTGKLIEILQQGLDNARKFCSFRDVYNKIEDDFEIKGLPHPQQANVNTADQLLFFKNKKWKPEDELAWDKALKKNTKWAYLDFRRQYPSSIFDTIAKEKIFELDEAEHWHIALEKKTLTAFMDYLVKYPNGKYSDAANDKIAELRKFEEERNLKQMAEAQRIRDEELAAKRKIAEEWAAQQQREAELEAQRIRDEELAAKRKIAEELAAQQQREAELEAQRIRDEELQAIREMEIAAKRKKEEEESRAIREKEMAAKQKRAEQKAAQQKREEELEAQRLRDEQTAAKRKRAEEKAAQQKKAAAEKQRLRDEEIAAKRKSAEEKTIDEKKTSTKGPGLTSQKKALLLGAAAMLFVIVFIGYRFINPSIHTVPDLHPFDSAQRPVGLAVSKLVDVEGGTFTMGDVNDEVENPALPLHQVTVDGFSIGKYEVTTDQFKQFVDEMKYHTTAEQKDSSKIYVLANGEGRWMAAKGVNWQYDIHGNRLAADARNIPVVHVSWKDANEYCKWLSNKTNDFYRLPTEAEWEFAASGGKDSRHFLFSGSSSIDSVAWYKENSLNTIHPVGQKQHNELGIFDMTGNALEWCNDWYDKDYYSNSPSVNPKGPDSAPEDAKRVLRGGSWSFDKKFCRNTLRFGFKADESGGSIGFRICKVNK